MMYSEETPNIPDDVWDNFMEEAWKEYQYIEEANGNPLDEDELYEEFLGNTGGFVMELPYEQIKNDIFNGEEPVVLK